MNIETWQFWLRPENCILFAAFAVGAYFILKRR